MLKWINEKFANLWLLVDTPLEVDWEEVDWEEGKPTPEVEDLLLAVDAAGVDAAKCALVDDWEGVYRNRAIIKVLQAQLAKQEAADG